MKGPARSSLGWRLYAVGVVQLALVLGAAILIGTIVAKLPPHGSLQGLPARLNPLLSRPKELSKQIAELRKREGLLLTLYDGERRVIASNVEPPLRAPTWGSRMTSSTEPPPSGCPPPPPPPPPWPPGGPPPGPPFFGGPPPPGGGPPPPGPPFGGPLALGGHRPPPPPDTYARLELKGGEGLVVARIEHPRPSPVPTILTLACGLVVVGAGAFLTTRWIMGPLGQLSRAARALGRGDLQARTDLRRADELGEVGRAFDEMAERLRGLLLAEKELLANVSHELRTPLARIRVALEIASEGDAVAARASLAEIAVDLAELEMLIDDVLAATRLAVASGRATEAGLALHAEEIAPRAICDRAAERFRARHPERPLEVHVEDGLTMIEADPILLRRVIDNLLENAHKYSPDESQPIILRAMACDTRVGFEVEDRGMGIVAEDLPRVFIPFFRGERSRSRGTGGVGLGLTLAKRIVEAHGGTIEVTSTRPGGTIVRAVIPRQRS